MPVDQLTLCERINEIFPARNNNPDWQWRVPLCTEYYSLESPIEKDKVFRLLDEALGEIWKFEDKVGELVKG